MLLWVFLFTIQKQPFLRNLNIASSMNGFLIATPKLRQNWKVRHLYKSHLPLNLCENVLIKI